MRRAQSGCGKAKGSPWSGSGSVLCCGGRFFSSRHVEPMPLSITDAEMSLARFDAAALKNPH